MKTEVLLRDVEPDDLPIFFEHQRDPVAVAMVVFGSRDKAEFDEHWAKILADDAVCEVGCWIDHALWGRGIASAALCAFLCLEQSRPLYAGVAPHNIASIRVLQKCGFTLCNSAIDQEPELAGESHILLRLGETG